MPEKQAICVYSVGERFVGPNFDGLPVNKFADKTLMLIIDARKTPDPANESGLEKQLPLVPGYNLSVRDKILSYLPRGWLDEVWEKQVEPKLNQFVTHPEKYQYLQIMVTCGAGYQRSPAIASIIFELLVAKLKCYKKHKALIKCFHLSAKMAHWIKTKVDPECA